MVSHELHKKYGKMLEINENVQEKVDMYIDNTAHHDFYDNFIISNISKLLYTKVYYDVFDFNEYFNSEHRKNIEAFKEQGIRCFILHVILDKIERHLRKKTHKYIDSLRPNVEFYFFADSKTFWEFIDRLDLRNRLGPLSAPPKIYALIFEAQDFRYSEEFRKVADFIKNHLPEIIDDIISEEDIKIEIDRLDKIVDEISNRISNEIKKVLNGAIQEILDKIKGNKTI